jgi:hypothetical protein
VGGGREVHDALTRELRVLSAILSEHVGCINHVVRVREGELNESLDDGNYGHRVRHAEPRQRSKKRDVLTSDIKNYVLCLRVRHPGLNTGETVRGDELYVQGGLWDRESQWLYHSLTAKEIDGRTELLLSCIGRGFKTDECDGDDCGQCQTRKWGYHCIRATLESVVPL